MRGQPPTRSRRPATRPQEGGFPPGIRQGDGVFETIRTYAGRPFLLERHLDRLRHGARAIGLTPVPPLADLDHACRRHLRRAARSAPRNEWIVRPMVYATPTGPTVAVEVSPLPPRSRRPPARPVLVGVSSYSHPGRYLVPAGAMGPVKWLARGPLAHALREARARGWTEALLEDSRGRLVEGTRSNLWAVVNGTLLAPGPESLALAGITRSVVLEDARRLAVVVEERAVERSELRAATEVMLSSSLLGLASVGRVAGRWTARRRLGTPVGDRLRRSFAARTAA